jgi:hypothetical protein
MMLLAVAVCWGLLLVVPVVASADGCANAAFRGGVSGALPDCRAYEMVSPLGFEPFRGINALGYEASVAGGRIAFYSKYGAPEGTGSASFGPYFLSTRGPAGWSTENVIPPQSTAGGDFCNPSIVFSPGLSKGVLQDGWNWGEGYPRYPDDNGSTNCSHDEPALVAGEPRGAQNLFLRDNNLASYQLVNLTSPVAPPRDAWFQGGSSDFSHLLFTDPNVLTPEAPAPPTHAAYFYSVGEDLYEWVGGVLRLVTLLPDGTPVWGLLANGDESGGTQGSASWTHALSTSGERVFFIAGGEARGVGEGQTYVGGSLYLRENAGRAQSAIAGGACVEPAKACTVQIDSAAPEASGAGGGGHFQWASADGSRVFFTDESKLTVDSTAEAGKPDLYEYDVNPETGAAGTLTDLTVHAGEPADVQGLSGVSDDGSYVYFVGDGALTGGQANSQGATAQPGKPNLYLRHAAATTFIATLDALGENPQEGAEEGDSCDWNSYSAPGGAKIEPEQPDNCMSARVSPDGSFLAFNSLRSLTGYNNLRVGGGGERNHEIFLYQATQNTLSCVSCDPNGSPPTAEARGGEDPHIAPPTHGEQWYRTPSYLGHYLTDTGDVFFSTTNQLLPADENTAEDVYASNHGKLSLISTGKSPDMSRFRDATPNGDDIYFLTTQALIGTDTDNTLSLYDARVNGGFPEPTPPLIPCPDEDACHGAAATPPTSTTPLSTVFTGPPNPTNPTSNPPTPPTLHCKKGYKKIKTHGHTICKHATKHHKHKHHH